MDLDVSFDLFLRGLVMDSHPFKTEKRRYNGWPHEELNFACACTVSVNYNFWMRRYKGWPHEDLFQSFILLLYFSINCFLRDLWISSQKMHTDRNFSYLTPCHGHVVVLPWPCSSSQDFALEPAFGLICISLWYWIVSYHTESYNEEDWRIFVVCLRICT
jgi:hypothetical protein